MPELSHWETFYVIVGAAAGALIGLQFVVMTLIAERPSRGVAEASAAFATPTIVHFCLAFLLSAIMTAGWQTFLPAVVLWGLTGVGGLAYTLVVARRMREQGAYQPEFEDWLFHVLLPVAAYGVLGASALFATSLEHEALFAVGASSLLLVFVGIHNAWDAVVYHVVVQRARVVEAAKKSDGAGGKDTRPS